MAKSDHGDNFRILVNVVEKDVRLNDQHSNFILAMLVFRRQSPSARERLQAVNGVPDALKHSLGCLWNATIHGQKRDIVMNRC